MKFDRYIFFQLAGASILATSGLLFVTVPGVAVGAMSRLPGVGTLTFIKYMPFAIAMFVPFVVPIAFLLAVVSTYGRLAQDSEWTAMNMTGINPYRLLLPALLLGLLVTGVTFFTHAEVLPRLDRMKKAFRVEALRGVVKNLSPGRTELHHGEFHLIAQDRRDNVFYDALIELPLSQAEGTAVLDADAVRIEFTPMHLLATLRGIRIAHGSQGGRFEQATVKVPIDRLVGGDEPDYVRENYLTTRGLLRGLDSGTLTPKQVIRFELALHRRMANAATGIVFVLLGVSTGLLMRRGTQLAALAVSAGYALLYWILSLRLGHEMVTAGVIAPWTGAWGPLVLYALLGGFLTWKVFRQ